MVRCGGFDAWINAPLSGIQGGGARDVVSARLCQCGGEAPVSSKCSGSPGARPDNDLPGMMEWLGARVHFLHLRHVALEGTEIRNSFYEAMHLEGDTDMVAMIAAVLKEEGRFKAAGRADCAIPMRPDHGQDILDDLGRKVQPGYPAIGRLRGLAELRGILTALDHPLVAGA